MASTERPVKVGLIGCGQAAVRGHLPALKRVRGAEVVALADLNPDRLRQVADRFGIERRCANVADLLEHPGLEAVAVCVPARFHVEVAAAVLEAGKHLFLEKPLALSLPECDRLMETAEGSPGIATVGFNMRWHRLVRQARQLVRAGRLGEVRMIRTGLACRGHNVGSVPEWRKRRVMGGGSIVDIAIHDFDLWRFLLDGEVEEVFAASRPGETDDEVVAVAARMAGGALASSSYVECTAAQYEVEVFGSAGRLALACYRFDGLRVFPLSSSPGDPLTRLRGAAHTLKELPRALLRRGGVSDYNASFQGEWRHFRDAVRHGTMPECTLADGRRAQEIVLAAVESASTGRPVKVAEAPGEIRPPG